MSISEFQKINFFRTTQERKSENDCKYKAINVERDRWKILRTI